MYNRQIKFADAGIQTADLWCWKRPLDQLSHYQCPSGLPCYVSWFVTILSNEAATTFSFQNAVASSEEEAKKAAKKPSSSKTARAPEVSNPTPLEFDLSSAHFLEFVRFEKNWTWQLLFAKISRLTLLRFHHVVGGSTGPDFSLMRFDLHEKKLNGKNDTSFIRNKCCHLTEPHWIIMNVFLSLKSWKMPRCFRFIWDLVARLLNAGIGEN